VQAVLRAAVVAGASEVVGAGVELGSTHFPFKQAKIGAGHKTVAAIPVGVQTAIAPKWVNGSQIGEVHSQGEPVVSVIQSTIPPMEPQT